MCLILWLANVLGALEGVPATGLIIERPVAGLILIALFIRCAAWQWWVLTRPRARHLSASKPA